MTRQASDPLQALRARRRELAAAITGVGFTATGTVLQVRTVCGSPGCACHADPDKRHGPYWQHTCKIRNKTVTRRLTPAQAALYQEWISNERALRDLLAQMQQLSDQARELLLAGPPGHQSPAANLDSREAGVSPPLALRVCGRGHPRWSQGCTA